jgi:hypothetical protein
LAIVPAPISISRVLRVLSDDRCLALLKTIAILSGSASANVLKTRSKLSGKEYYSRMSGLKKACLVQREEGNYFLTSFGKIVYDSQSTIANALENFWKLEAINCFGVPQVKNKIIEILIKSPRLRESIVTDADANSNIVDNTSIIESNNSKSSNHSSIISNIKCDDRRTRRIPQLWA